MVHNQEISEQEAYDDDIDDVDVFWTMLSNTAEDLLGQGKGARRSSGWNTTAKQEVHKKARPGDTVRLRRLLRIQRGLRELQRGGGDDNLLFSILRHVRSFVAWKDTTVLQVMDMKETIDKDIVDEEGRVQRRGVHRWMAKVDEDIKAQRA